MRLSFESSHVRQDFSNGRLVVRVTIEDDERQFTRREDIFFSVPPDFHAHNDLVAAALMAVMGRGFRSACFNFPISEHCAAILPMYHQLEEVGPVDPHLEQRRPGRFIGVSFSGGLDSVGILTLLRDVAQLDVKVVTAEYDGFHREAVGYASYHRDVSCWTNFRRVFGDRGRRFDAAIPLLFADYADLDSFVSGHIFNSMPAAWVDPRSDEPFEFLPQDAVSAAGGLGELHIVRCLHAPGFLKFLIHAAPERIETAFHVTDAPGAPKYLMKGLMLQQIYAELGRRPPDVIANLTLPRRREMGRNCGPWCVWTQRNVPHAMAIQVTPRIAEIDFSPLADLKLDFYWRYCPITANLIPESFRDTLLTGLRATGVVPYDARDYDELQRVREFLEAVNPPGAYAPE